MKETRKLLGLPRLQDDEDPILPLHAGYAGAVSDKTDEAPYILVPDPHGGDYIKHERQRPRLGFLP